MTKTERLNNHFERWQAERNYKGFKKDGIINEALFKPPHVLFICKEPNDPHQAEGDYRQWWNEEMLFAFSRRIGEWSHGIFNGFPPYADFTDQDSHLALKSIAFMNVKKVGGSSRADHSAVQSFLSKDLHFLKEEIDTIDPSLIICCLGFSVITKALFPEIPDDSWKDPGYNTPFVRSGKRLILDFYHPSAPVPGAMSYVFLEKILNKAGYGS